MGLEDAIIRPMTGLLLVGVLLAGCVSGAPTYGGPLGGVGDSGASDDTGASVDSGGTGDWLPMVRIPAGSFEMGAPEAEPGRHDDEALHEVTLTRDLWLGTTVVTEGQWLSLAEALPEGEDGPCGEDCPVRWVSWHAAAAWTVRLAEATGEEPCYACTEAEGEGVRCSPTGSAYDCGGPRLPTEAEWEYAMRAGSEGGFHTGASLVAGTEEDCEEDLALDDGTALSELGWWCGNSGYHAHEVGQHAPNAWGLHDVHGLSYEWVHDGYADYPEGPLTDPEGPAGAAWVSHRGGSWGSKPYNLRLGRRSPADPTVGGAGAGLRVARTAP